MKLTLKISLVALVAALGACQTNTADRNSYDASTEASPGVETPGQTDDLSPRIDLPPDSTGTMSSAADTTTMR